MDLNGNSSEIQHFKAITLGQIDFSFFITMPALATRLMVLAKTIFLPAIELIFEVTD